MIIRIEQFSRFRIRPGKEADDTGRRIKPGTTAFVAEAKIGCKAWGDEGGKIKLCVNPAIMWEGTYAELFEYWEPVPDATPLTF